MKGGGGMELWTFWAAMLGVLGFLQTLLPKEYTTIFHTWVRRLLHQFMPYVFFDIPEFYGAGGNEIYEHVQAYLSSPTAMAAQHVNLCRPRNATQNTFSLAHNESVEESFQGATLWWSHEVSARPQAGGFNSWGSEAPMDEKRKYTLKMRKGDKSRVLEAYVQHIIDVAGEVKDRSRDRLLYTNIKTTNGFRGGKAWESVPFKHPSTFDTLAMEPDLKEEIKADLLDFTNGEAFYQKAGKAWKRGYLLYGPPGTGKSSMIAAIANFLQYDVYDVELTEVASNSELRKLLIQTTNRSVIVIEDIDCSIDVAERAQAQKVKDDVMAGPGRSGRGAASTPDEASRVTLSGLLNFTDGLWSCCGRERIIIFTTNYIEKLDKALLRAGRMDKHIHMSWCGFPAFQTLARNNLGLEWHDLFPEIEAAIANKAIAPAEVSELMLKKKRNPTAALEGLLDTLERTKLVSEIPLAKVNMHEEEQTSEKVPDDRSPFDQPSIDMSVLHNFPRDPRKLVRRRAESSRRVSDLNAEVDDHPSQHGIQNADSSDETSSGRIVDTAAANRSS